MDSLQGKVVLITGASSGIGAIVAEELVKCGMKVVGIARRADRLSELKAKLASGPGEFHGVKADITVEQDVLNVFEFIRKQFGTIDVVINNAGIVKYTTLSGPQNHCDFLLRPI